MSPSLLVACYSYLIHKKQRHRYGMCTKKCLNVGHILGFLPSLPRFHIKDDISTTACVSNKCPACPMSLPFPPPLLTSTKNNTNPTSMFLKITNITVMCVPPLPPSHLEKKNHSPDQVMNIFEINQHSRNIVLALLLFSKSLDTGKSNTEIQITP